MSAGIDVIEFYDGESCVVSVKSSIVPPVGSKISIRGEAWSIVKATYAVDHSDDYALRRMRANVDIKRG